ncbi:MAG: HEPN domain-containing protein [Prevotella sp.]|nr:HEPN domain-containing protein [Prevotella sp.]
MANESIAKAWFDIAEEDISAAEWMHKGGKWLYVAFECHQALEKLIKGYWSVARDDDPPLLHNHERLLMGCGLYNKLSDEQMKFLEQMHPMYIAGRYPQYKKQVASTLNEQASQYFIEQTKKFQQWILQRYLEKTKPLNL